MRWEKRQIFLSVEGVVLAVPARLGSGNWETAFRGLGGAQVQACPFNFYVFIAAIIYFVTDLPLTCKYFVDIEATEI